MAQGIFERMYNMFPEDNKHRLTIQYRMHPTIGTLISHVFYNDEIQNGVEAQDRELCIEGYEELQLSGLVHPSIRQKSGMKRNLIIMEKNHIKIILSEILLNENYWN